MVHVDPESSFAKAESALLDEIIERRQIRSVYQPVVDLDDGRTIGWEALARGPEGSILEMPDRLFAAARRESRVEALDFVCQAAAIEGAVAAGLDQRRDLFVNYEPPTAGVPRPDFVERASVLAKEKLRVMIEITERDLTAHPAELIALIKRLRNQSHRGIALDDVGVDPRSIGLIPLVKPDIIKLDMSLLHEPMNRDRARAVHAVLAEAERAGAKVLAEGIENEAHLRDAKALGARFGQGWHFGRPGPIVLSDGLGVNTRRPIVWDREEPEQGDTPFEFLERQRESRVGSKPMLLQMSRALEAEALAQGPGTVLLSTFQHVRYFGPRTSLWYERLADETSFVGALAEGLGTSPAAGVRGADIEPGAKLGEEWDVVVLAPHFSAAVVSRECPASEDRPGRFFDHIYTYDRDLVATMASQLFAMITPEEVEP